MEEGSGNGKRARVACRARARELSALFRSWWLCALAPKGCQLALVLLSWMLFSFLVRMPCLVKGLVSRQSKLQDYINLNLCGDHSIGRASPALNSFVPDISGRLGENKDIEDFCTKGKHIHSNPQSLCFQTILAGFASEKKKSQKYSDEDAMTNDGSEQEPGQARFSNEIRGQEHVTKNLTFRSINGRTAVSCFLSPSNESSKKMSIQMEYLEKIQPVTSGESSSPSVAVRPSSMEWGPQPLFSPAVAFLTVLNTYNDTVLRIFKPFSTNQHFFAYGFEESVLAPGEMVPIAFIFLPRVLGLATGHLILQTSSGGFLIHAQGEGVESPYRIQPFTGLSASTGSLLRDNITLYNPFDGPLFVEEVSAWISSSKVSSLKPTGAICRTEGFTARNENFLLNEDSWFEFGKDATDISLVGIRPSGGWEISSYLSSTIMEMDISTHMEGKISGALCILLKNSFQDTRETVIMPLEVQIVKNTGIYPCIYPTPKDLTSGMASAGEQTVKVAFSLKNDGSEVIRLEGMYERSENGKLLQIEFLQGLILLPGTVTHVATVAYKVIEETNPCKDEVQPSILRLDCRLLVVTNSTQSPQIDLPCQDLFQNCISTATVSESFFGLSTTLTGQTESINVKNRFQGGHVSSPTVPKGKTSRFMSDADDLFLRDWKSQGTSENLSVLAQSDLWYPMVQIGMKSSKWVHVTNPSDQPVVMQLILSSEVIAAQCKDDGEDWELIQSYRTATRLLTKTTDDIEGHQYTVFFQPDNEIAVAYVQPHGSASLGPIFFQPLKRCVWTSSVFIKNNLSGVERLHLQGAGGSSSLTFLEGLKPVQALHFNINIPTPTPTLGVMKFYSNQIFHMVGMKAACTNYVQKILLARNTGDLPLEVNAIKVAGKDCGSNIFRIQPCDSFLLAPGESTELLVSYQSDFSSEKVSQDLQLAMSSGIFVIPLSASLPVYMVALCQRSFFWLITVTLFILLVAIFFVFWWFLAQKATKLDSNHWSEDNKFLIAKVEKIGGLTHSNPVKQRPTESLKPPEVECAQVKSSSIQCKSHKEQDTSTSITKAGKHVHKATKPSAFHEELEKNNLTSDFKCEHMNWLHNVNEVKWLHDGNNKQISKSGLDENKFNENGRSSEPSGAQASFFPNRIAGILNSSADPNWSGVPSDMLSSKAAQYSGHSLTVKLEKEKGRRRKKKSVAMKMKQDVSSSQSGNSTPPSPASPLTPVSSSGSISPIVKMPSHSNLMPLNSLSCDNFTQGMESVGCEYMCYEFDRKMPQGKGSDTLQACSIGDACTLHPGEVYVSKLSNGSSSKQISIPKIACETDASSKVTFKLESKGGLAAQYGDWATIAKQSTDITFNNSKGVHLQKLSLDTPSQMRPLLTTSATFPQRGCREPDSGWNPPVLDMKEAIVPSLYSPSLVSTSAIAPHARAPGTKLTKSNTTSLRPQVIEQDSTYDIWGNNFAVFPLRNSSITSVTTGLPSTGMSSPSSQESSQSLFAKFAPKSHLDKALSPSLSSNHSEFFDDFVCG